MSMASTLYLGTDHETLTDRLVSRLAEPGLDPFVPATVVVPNRYLAKWLRLRIARQQGVAINLNIESFLEHFLWQRFRELDPRPHPLPLQLLSDADYQLMLVATLLDDQGAGAERPLHEYLGARGTQPRRAYWRRLWQLGGRLAALLRDYEYHRQETLILPWLRGNDGYPAAPASELRLERAQRALFERIIREPDGVRARLGQALHKLAKSLPQYAGEIQELPQLRPTESRGPLHIFGLTQISWLHVNALRWLGRHYDLHFYYRNPLVGRAAEKVSGTLSAAATVLGAGRESTTERVPDTFSAAALRQLAERFRSTAERPADGELLHVLCSAGAESLWLMAELVNGEAPFRVERVEATVARKATVLTGLQGSLTGEAASGGLVQDTSIQIVGCPGVFREVATVYHSILDNLQRDAGLRQTDIAVMVTDMARYRPVIQTIFDRTPQRLLYNIADYSAAELSPFGHAVIGLLDLALESFTRSRVFEVLLSPCFLARQGMDHEQAGAWLHWVAELGVFHGWDRQDKRQRGYADSPLYSWRLGLQRLRLGRLMEVGDERGDAPARRYQGIIPFADLAAGDKEQLDAFSRSVEGLLPRLAELRTLQAPGARWADEIRQLVDDFLAVPADRPDEEQVRGALFQALARLPLLDSLHPEHAGLPLALIREFIYENLETLKATSGDFLTGGVTVAGLHALLPLPFRVVYVLGLGEDLFPGANVLGALDLRARERLPGDIRPAEANRFWFLEALLAAQEKIYLLYNNRDLQKDQVLHPASPVNQLRRFLASHLLGGKEFVITEAPLRSNDPQLLGATTGCADCLVTYSDTDRLLAIQEAQASGALRLDTKARAQVDARLQQAQHDFRFSSPLVGEGLGVGGGSAHDIPRTPITLSLHELRSFLMCPVEAALRRHLRLDDDEPDEPADDEPFFTDGYFGYRLMMEGLRRFVSRAIDDSVDAALQDWRPRFAALHDEWRLRGRVPEGAFAAVDRGRFEDQLEERIEAEGGLAEFLRQRWNTVFCGPVLLGESATPVGARTRFPALTLPLTGDAGTARLVGSLPLVWHGVDAIDVLVLTNRSSARVPAHALSNPFLEPLLFFLALRASGEPRSVSSRLRQPGANASRLAGEGLASWLEKRQFRIHVMHREGMVSFSYRPQDVSAKEARAYLTELVMDYLDRSSFDLLPFDLVANDPWLRQAYETDKVDEAVRAEYAAALRESFDEDQENDMPIYHPMRLLEIVPTCVPDDAYDKLRRRFRLFDRGPARARQEAGRAHGGD
jgi:exodeoxyribonuclease V gamma subunit